MYILQNRKKLIVTHLKNTIIKTLRSVQRQHGGERGPVLGSRPRPFNVLIELLPPRGFGECVQGGEEWMCEVSEFRKGCEEDLEREREDAEARAVDCQWLEGGLVLEQGLDV